MPRSLADGKTKFTILTTAPVDPEAPTDTELNAGVQAAPNILASDFLFGATDSDKVNEKALAEVNNANAIAASNFQCGFTPFRFFDATTGQPDPAGDVVFEAVKAKGTTLWVYGRRTGQDSDDPWASGDEIFLGAEVITDEPQPPSDLGGYIKMRTPCEVQRAYPFISAAAGV